MPMALGVPSLFMGERDFRPDFQAYHDMDGNPVAILPFNTRASAVARASNAMGGGQSEIWHSTYFTTHANIHGPYNIFGLYEILTYDGDGQPMTANRFCLHEWHSSALGSLKTMFIYVDGACSNNNWFAMLPRGGYAFVFNASDKGILSGALERRGPDGGDCILHTSNRAKLRAVLAALDQQWYNEHWERIVFVTDSEWLARRATENVKSWAERGWRFSNGKPVANRDMWKAFSKALGEYAENGCEVSFWIVPQQWNARAEQAARQAATEGVQKEDYTTTFIEPDE